MLPAPYVVRYHTKDGPLGELHILASSAADALTQVKACNPALHIAGVDLAGPAQAPTDSEQVMATELLACGGFLHRLADRLHGKGLYEAQQHARSYGTRAFTAAGQVLSRG